MNLWDGFCDRQSPWFESPNRDFWAQHLHFQPSSLRFSTFRIWAQCHRRNLSTVWAPIYITLVAFISQVGACSKFPPNKHILFCFLKQSSRDLFATTPNAYNCVLTTQEKWLNVYSRSSLPSPFRNQVIQFTYVYIHSISDSFPI